MSVFYALQFLSDESIVCIFYSFVWSKIQGEKLRNKIAFQDLDLTHTIKLDWNELKFHCQQRLLFLWFFYLMQLCHSLTCFWYFNLSQSEIRRHLILDVFLPSIHEVFHQSLAFFSVYTQASGRVFILHEMHVEIGILHNRPQESVADPSSCLG